MVGMKNKLKFHDSKMCRASLILQVLACTANPPGQGNGVALLQISVIDDQELKSL